MRDQAQRLRELVRTNAAEEDSHDRKSLQHDRRTTSRCRTIAVTSGKGGVGKTNVALFLAAALSSIARKRVLLIDGDLGLANVHILLGLAPRRNISHAVEGECGLVDTISAGPAGIDIVPGASGLESLANLDAGRLEMLRREFQTLENSYDIIVLDTGAGIGSGVIRFAAHADLTLCVMTPEPTSLADAYAMVKVLYDKGAPRIGILVNMAASDREGAETFDRIDTLVIKFIKKKVELYGILPFEKEIGRFVRKQKVFTLENPQSRTAARIQTVVRKICGLPPAGQRGFFARLLHKNERGAPGPID